jgi:hypothetical protein
MVGAVRMSLCEQHRRAKRRRPQAARASLVIFALALVAATTFAADIVVFGPRTYNGNGRPILDKRTFRIQNQTPLGAGTYTLRVRNRGVTNALVALNGRLVLLPRDFGVRVEAARFEGGRFEGGQNREEDDRRREDAERRAREERARQSDREEQGWTPDWDQMRRDGERQAREDRERDRRDDGRYSGGYGSNLPGRGLPPLPEPVPLIEREVTLRNGNNNLVVGFLGRRGTSLTIEIVKKDGGTTDTVPPTIAATASPAPNASGWYNGNVTVTFACDDTGGSGVATCPAPVVVTTEGANQAISGTAVDVAGNMASASVTVNIDKTAPVVSASASPGANANGWNNAPVAVTFAASDALSGVVPGSLTTPVMLGTDGANLSATGQATDLAGNVGVAVLAGINIDQVAPALSVALPPPPGSGSYYGGPVTAQFTCSDTGSGIAACPPNQIFSMEGASQTATGTVTDLAGNSASATSMAFGIDLTMPTISVSLSPGPNGNGWNNEPVTAHFTCSDTGSGIAACPADQIVSADGTGLTVNGTATDQAGHSASVTSAPFNLDRTAPSIAAALTPAPGASGYVNAPVTVQFTCSDAGSGIAAPCPADQQFSMEGANQTATGTVADLAGNTASATSAAFGIDLGAPVVTVSLSPAANANGWNNVPVTAHFTCSDAGAGVAVCPPDKVIVADGTNLSVTGTATDLAGNAASVTSAPFNLDRTPPTIAVALSPAPGGGYANAPVTAHFTCADPLSGVSICPPDQVVSTEGTGITVSGTVSDLAGNTASAASAPFSIDLSPPVVTVSLTPAANANGWNNVPVTAHFTCTDTGAGVASCPSDQIVNTEGTSLTVAGTVTDLAGNAAAVTSELFSIDLTPPVVAAGFTPAPNAAGWNNTPVTVQFTCTDARSGVFSAPDSQVVSAEGPNQTVSGTCVDRAGNTASITSAPIDLDLTPPTIVVEIIPPGIGLPFFPLPTRPFYSTSVTVHFTCSDTGSGVVACPPDEVIGTEATNIVVSGTVTDAAGNSASVTSPPFSIDLNPPTISASVFPLPNANGWNNTPVTVHFTCDDAGSGLASCPPDQVLATEGANQTVTGTATDEAGQSATVTSPVVRIDMTSPTINVTLSPLPGAGFLNVPVTASFDCADALSGVGVCPPAQVVSTEGVGITVSGTVTDLAGNTAIATSLPFSIDFTPPVVTATVTPAPNAAGWNNTPVTVRFTCTDGGAGVAECPADQIVSQSAAAQAVTGVATDAAGNTAAASATVNLDMEPPVLTWTSPAPGSNIFSPTVTGAGAIVETLSGIASATCNGASAQLSGSTLTCDVSLTPGANTIAGSVTDRAGNTGTAGLPVTYTTGPGISDFNPKSASPGTLITVAGTNLAPNPRITLNRLGGGTLDAPVMNTGTSSVAFVVPAGAATGPITLVVGSDTVGSASPLTIAASSNFALSVQPATVTLVAGQSVSVAVSLSSGNAFAQLATLQVAGVPSGATASFAPARITAGQTSVLTFTAPPGQASESSSLTIAASATVEGLLQSESALAQLSIATPTTSLLGRIVVSDTLETPLAGVSVTMLGKNGNGGTTSCTGSTVSDAAGNFLLGGLGAGCVGPQLVGYDGTTATSPEGEYAGVNLIYTLAANQATASPVLVHLPRIDDKETFFVRQNSSTEQSYLYKTIPGLSVTVYPGTTFTLENGTRPDPFPLVAVQVPVDRLPDAKPPVPTMFNSFIVAFQPANAVASKPAAVFYPNTLNTHPGVNMPLLTLDPTRGRMLPYGTATVSANGRQIVPDLNPSLPGTRYGIVNFDWHGAMPPPPPEPPDNPPVNPPCPICPCDVVVDEPLEVGDPCDVTSGLQVVRATDIAIGGSRGSVSVARTYRTLSTNPGPFGIGSSHNYGYFLSPNAPQNALLVNLIVPQGNWVAFSRSSTSEPLVNDTIPSLQGVRMETSPMGTPNCGGKTAPCIGLRLRTP